MLVCMLATERHIFGQCFPELSNHIHLPRSYLVFQHAYLKKHILFLTWWTDFCCNFNFILLFPRGLHQSSILKCEKKPAPTIWHHTTQRCYFSPFCSYIVFTVEFCVSSLLRLINSVKTATSHANMSMFFHLIRLHIVAQFFQAPLRKKKKACL